MQEVIRKQMVKLEYSLRASFCIEIMLSKQASIVEMLTKATELAMVPIYVTGT